MCIYMIECIPVVAGLDDLGVVDVEGRAILFAVFHQTCDLPMKSLITIARRDYGRDFVDSAGWDETRR
jgi:hypothetical protein